MLGKLRKNIRDLGYLTPVALVCTFMPIVGSTLLLMFIMPIGHWLRDNWEIGILVFLAGTLFFCGLALLPTNIIGIVSGWAFGFEVGLLVLMCGVIGSSFISFVINSRISGGHFPKVIEKYPRSTAIYKALLKEDLKKTTMIIILLRMSVIMPFALTNFLMAASRAPIRAFLIGTAVGMLPRSAAMVFIGSGLSELDLANGSETYLYLFGLVATIVSVAVIAVISRKALERLTREEASAEA
ncbi:MAG: TVP38/TMEM64 family protein [Pyrinomonadaceae bacterium]|nr:TVP38/TMEM64 family protein [Pyrinomonadaceae bacterium]MBP6213143.1 TVP38/TMEM64 family protein [Pyrinomonadaceae bacterium]